ncbi:uncharacterized MFS-type transporter C09D4.1-like isoform X2 [Venturia canescens]|uniref:uncharacterized MFS-type transporter C09D4.1-like isoform X2 n=1 Tax=Venturia canescens TaxID=32260 RepID=UPI001C9C39ED|nr:uncharacterized MFS-type transporter C09D4.1-like isoform X2 [Venturia canescens]
MANDSEKLDHLIHGDSSIAPSILKLNAVNNQTSINYFEKEAQQETKLYKSRWIVLFLFIFYSATSTFQWVEYSIITNIVARYYGVSSLAVDWTSMSYMLYYVILVFPGSYFSERIGLRWTTILSCILCCIGSWIKVFSVQPDRFLMTFIGQSFVASTQVFLLTTPGRLAAQWFDSDQISTATSLGLFGNQLGIAVCFFLVPIVVKNHVNLDDIGNDLYQLFLAVAVITSVATLLVLIFFRNEPRLPPSTTRALQRANHSTNKEGFVEPMKRLLANKSFLILCNSYGLNVGVFNAVGTLLNQIYLYHFENGEEDAGRLGLAIIVMGMVGSVTFGIILDKTKKFKGTIVTVYLLTLLGQIMFAIAMWCEVKWMVYVAATFLGCIERREQHIRNYHGPRIGYSNGEIR